MRIEAIEFSKRSSISNPPVAPSDRVSGARVESAAMEPDDDREAVGAVVDGGVGVHLGRGGGFVLRDEDVEVEAILARPRAAKVSS